MFQNKISNVSIMLHINFMNKISNVTIMLHINFMNNAYLSNIHSLSKVVW